MDRSRNFTDAAQIIVVGAVVGAGLGGISAAILRQTVGWGISGALLGVLLLLPAGVMLAIGRVYAERQAEIEDYDPDVPLPPQWQRGWYWGSAGGALLGVLVLLVVVWPADHQAVG